MTVEFFQAVLGWSGLINMGVLLFWAFLIFIIPDWIYEIHRKFYPISRESFDNIHYAGMMIYKLFNFMFFIVPYIALRLISWFYFGQIYPDFDRVR